MRRTRCLLTILSIAGVAVLSRAADLEEVLSDYRIRSDFTAGLNADTGWAAGINEPGVVKADRPFRLRLQLTSQEGRDVLRHYVLWFRRNEGDWQPVKDSDFPYPDYASPLVSLVSPPYPRGAATEDLIPHGELEHGEDGAGQGLAPVSTRAGETGVASEWEFPLVIRLFADGPIRLNEGDTFEFRLSHLHGDVVPSRVSPIVTVDVPANHLGGTFVETPGRIGPWKAADGSLYFIMEPTETDNRFMMVKSMDNGVSWFEVDGENRPPARDLEAVDAVLQGDLLHIAHMEDVVWYHSFRMTSSAGQAEGWVTRSELIAKVIKPPVQSVGIELLDDGNPLVWYADGEDFMMRVRSKGGDWEFTASLDAPIRISGIQLVKLPANRFALVFTDGDGNGWLQVYGAKGPEGMAFRLSSNIGKTEADVGSILTPLYLDEDQAIVTVYREKDGSLHERRLNIVSGELSDPVQIVTGPVIQNSVDSDQTGADLVFFDGGLHVVYIHSGNGSIFHTRSTEPGTWSAPVCLVENISGSWIRANGLEDSGIGIVYDAGSLGGSGMNRFLWVDSPEEKP